MADENVSMAFAKSIYGSLISDMNVRLEKWLTIRKYKSTSNVWIQVEFIYALFGKIKEAFIGIFPAQLYVKW